MNVEDYIDYIERRVKKETCSGIPAYTIEFVTKSITMEMILTQYIINRYGKSFFSRETLNNWVNCGDNGKALVIRYSTNQHEYEQILEGIKTDKLLPLEHPERSLLYSLEDKEEEK